MDQNATFLSSMEGYASIEKKDTCCILHYTGDQKLEKLERYKIRKKFHNTATNHRWEELDKL